MKKDYFLRSVILLVIAGLIGAFLSPGVKTVSALDDPDELAGTRKESRMRALSSESVHSESNGIYKLFIETDNGAGTFTVATGNDHPFPRRDILFGGASGNPWSSYLTVRSYTSETDYVSVDETGLSSSFTAVRLDPFSPVVRHLTEGTGFRTTWSVTGDDTLAVEQVTEIEGTTINDSVVRVTTTVTNDGESPVLIGIRYMWDWKIDTSDNAKIKRHHPDDPAFTSTFFEAAPPLFEYYEETNVIPTFGIFGTVNGPASLNPPPTPPDRFNYSRWSTAYQNSWDFPVTGGNTDSATCYFWGDTLANAIPLEPGQSYSVTQYMTTFEQSIALTISGVVQSGGVALAGVSMGGLPGSPTTDNNGYYEGSVPYGWSGTVAPAKEGHSFAPVSRSYTNVTSNQPNQDYAATPDNHTISGYVRTSDLSGIGGVVMNGLPGTPSTDNNGYYEATVPNGWSGTVTPGKNNYIFDPSSRVYANVTSSKTEENYTGTLLTFTVTGSVPGGHGTVAPTLQIVVNDGPATINIYPDPGYHILSIVDNGISKAIANPYAIAGVREDHTVVVTFELDAILSVTPLEGLSASGNEGGPFAPTNKDYSLSNAGGGDLNWTVSADQTWVTVSPSGGTNSGTVTVSINADANSLEGSPVGTTHTATVTFNSNGGSTTRQVSLMVYHRSLAYITNAGEDTVSVVDIMGNRALSKIDVGQGPLGVAVNPQKTAVYVTNYDSNDVSVIDTVTNTVVATVKVGSNPVGMAIDKTGSTLFVVNYKSNNLSVVDTSTNQVIATVKVGLEPCGVAVSPDGSAAYVTNYRSGTVSVIKKVSSTYQVTAKIKVGSGPYGIAVHPAGSLVYVTNYAAGTVSVINATTNKVAAKVRVGGSPAGVAVNPAGTFVYITKNEGETVSVMDTTTNKIVKTVKVGSGPFGIATNMDGTRIYVANSEDNTISVVDSSDYGIEATVPVGDRPVAFGDFVASRQEGAPFALRQIREAASASEGDLLPKRKVRSRAHPPHIR